MTAGFRRGLPGILGGLGLVALAWLATWQLSWLGADLHTPVSHGINEDWDWQLGLYEASRLSLLDHGQLPGWNPFVQGGVPLLANPESPFLYPPFLLVVVFGTTVGIKLWVLFHLVALVAACWWAGRRMGLGPLEAHGPGILALTSAQLPAQTAMGHIMYLPLCWLPLAFVAARAGRWRLAGLCLAMPVLAGAHHVFLYTLLLLLADALLQVLDPRRIPLLGLWLVANLLLLGQSWAAWPLGILGLAVLFLQRPQGGGASWHPLVRLGAAVVLAGLLSGPKLATLPALWARAERLAPQVALTVADAFTPGRALQVLLGQVDRPSAHNGQNVLYSPVPLVLAALGVAVALRRRPRVAVAGLLFLNLGWGGATPVNLLQVVHRLPPWDHIRVVERYGGVWTLFLGWFGGWALWWLWRLRRPPWLGPALTAAAALAVAWHLHLAAPRAAWHYRIGPGRPHPIPPAGTFVQVDDVLTGWEAMRANRGKPRCWTTAWLEDPGPVKVQGDPAYRGEVTLADGTPVPATITPNRITFHAPVAGRLVVNQNAFAGWRHDGRPAGSEGGLLAADVQAGPGVLAYRPPGLLAGVLMSLAGGVVLAWPLLRRRSAAARGAGSVPSARASA